MHRRQKLISYGVNQKGSLMPSRGPSFQPQFLTIVRPTLAYLTLRLYLGLVGQPINLLKQRDRLGRVHCFDR